MTWQPVSFVEPILQHSFGDPVSYPNWTLRNGADLVIVPITSPKPKPSLPPLLDYHPTEALALREAMMRDRDRAMQRRDMRAVNQIESDLRDVVMVAMMGRGR